MHKFNPQQMDRLLSEDRKKLLPPDQVLGALGLTAGAVMLDIGAGPGFFTLPAAELVGPSGKVYGLDIAPAMLERLRERAAEAGLGNVETLVSEEDRLPLPDGVADAALLANVLHEVHGPVAFLREIARTLRPGGALAVVEWRKEQMEKGPPLHERLSEAEVEEMLREAGYGPAERFAVGPGHYGLKARPAQ